MPNFFTHWEVNRLDGERVYYNELSNQGCRDGAMYTLARGVRDQFYKSIKYADLNYSNEDIGYTLNTLADNAWYKWALLHHANLRYTGSYYENYDLSIHTWMRDYTVPRAIEKLVNKYPTVSFSIIENMTPSASWTQPDRVRVGIQVEGDASIIPAFYWAGMIQRVAARERFADPNASWKDVNKLLERYPNNQQYLEAWDRVREGTEPASNLMLAFSQGPIDTWYARSLGQEYKDPENVTLRPEWFNVEYI